MERASDDQLRPVFAKDTIAKKLLVLENLDYGNALYVFEENWEELTQLSRAQLMKRRDPGVHRLPHLPGWQSAIRTLLRDTE